MAAQLYSPVTLASLYVGDLDPTVTETDLWLMFNRTAPVYYIHLCRDRFSGHSLRYAYVNFLSPFYADAAITSLNHMSLKGKPMRIMRCERDPRKRKTGHGNLFVKNLAPSITSTCLEKIFCNYGTILSCKVAEDDGKSKGFGFVQFDSVESSIAAIHALHGTMLAGKKLYVSKFLKKNQRGDALEEPTFTSLYVMVLGGDLTLEFLKGKFSEFGELLDTRIIRGAAGRSLGYGFVDFKSHEDAKAAMEALDGVQSGCGKLVVRKAQKRAETKELLRSEQATESNYSNLYVKYLHPSVTNKELREHFGSFGKVMSAKVMRYNNGISRRFGFVSFSTPEEAHRARRALDGTTFLGNKPLYVGKAERKEDRQRKLQTQYAFTHQVHPNYSSFIPAFSILNTASYTSSHKSMMHQQYWKSEVEMMYPFAAQSYQQEVFTYVPQQLSQQQNWIYRTAINQHPTENPNAGRTARKMTWHRNHKDQKICSAKRSEAACSSPSIFSDVENIQPGHGVKTPGKASLEKSPKALTVQADKSVQVLVETNYQSGGNYNQFSAQSSKSVCCLSY